MDPDPVKEQKFTTPSSPVPVATPAASMALPNTASVSLNSSSILQYDACLYDCLRHGQLPYTIANKIIMD